MEGNFIPKKGNMQDTLLSVHPCKIELEDFDYQSAISSRLLVEKLNTSQMHVLEEILYSPLKICIDELCDNTDTDTLQIHSILEALSPLGLFTVEGNKLLVKKDARKYFEMLIEKFADDFSPDLDYFRNLIKHVPIHSVVAWFHIPRTSNNIFNSIIEKHFLTPKTYEKYIKETLVATPEISEIAYYVINSKEDKVSCKEILEKFTLTEEQLEEKILLLEYHYIAASCYEVQGDHYEKYLSLFAEWKTWRRNSQSLSEDELSLHEDEIERMSDDEFAFIEDMSIILKICDQIDLRVAFNQKEELFFLDEDAPQLSELRSSDPSYIARIINKNLLLGLCVIEEDVLRQTPPAVKWLATPLKKRTLITFKHPHNALSHKSNFSFHQHDRNIIEVQKALATVENDKWIMFDEFMERYLSLENTLKQAELKKVGRKWQFETAEYDPKEIEFIKLVVLGWLFESGMVIPGRYQNQDCFKVTSLIYELYR